MCSSMQFHTISPWMFFHWIDKIRFFFALFGEIVHFLLRSQLNKMEFCFPKAQFRECYSMYSLLVCSHQWAVIRLNERINPQQIYHHQHCCVLFWFHNSFHSVHGCDKRHYKTWLLSTFVVLCVLMVVAHKHYEHRMAMLMSIMMRMLMVVLGGIRQEQQQQQTHIPQRIVKRTLEISCQRARFCACTVCFRERTNIV